MPPAVVWFRRDLRLADHPALAAAAHAAGDDGVVGCFVVDDRLRRASGPARAAFLAGCLEALDRSMGAALVVRRGPPEAAVPALAAEVGAERVYVTADAAPYGRARDARVAEALARQGRSLAAVGTNYAVAPGRVTTAAGTGFRVFTAFRRAWEAEGWAAPSPAADVVWLGAPSDAAPADVTDGAGAARPRWWGDLPDAVPRGLPAPGEAAALGRLVGFAAGGLGDYPRRRDTPGVEGTSRLSPYLRFGCCHPRQVLAAVADAAEGPAGAGAGGAAAFSSELAWREFYADVLFHRPGSATETMQPSLARLAYDTGPAARDRFFRWALGETGYPMVDAAMRQLLTEGWVHNRARMVAASFLVKDLHLDWRWGARWFMYRLVDGDLASNQHGWQWTAGTGTDAAPFHRIFNPATQAERFDPDGEYARRHLPELAGPAPGRYPSPIVDHRAERVEALRRFAEARAASRGVAG